MHKQSILTNTTGKLKKTILIVMEEEKDRKFLASMFADEYELLQTTTSHSTIDILNTKHDDIALLVCDFEIAEHDGFRILSYLNEQRWNDEMTVIVMMNRDCVHDEVKLYELGVDDVIHQPFDPMIVKHKIQRICTQIEDEKKRSELIRNQTNLLKEYETFDRLTGLFNLDTFLERANWILKDAHTFANGKRYAVIYRNICNFKYYNAKNGVHEGDEVLQFLAQIIQDNYSEDLNARFGNDHFVTLTNRLDILDAVAQIISTFNAKYKKYGIQLKSGIYFVDTPGIAAVRAADCAKIACDTIYNQTKDYYIFDEKLDHKINIMTHVIENLDSAIENHHVKVYYQPVIRTINRTLCGMEALVRWDDPFVGFLSPNEFIPVLEENHFITIIDLYVLEESCRLIKRMIDQGEDIVPISFNLSRFDFTDCDIFHEVDAIVMKYGVARDMIHIEITESAMMDDPSTIQKIVRRFRDVGYEVWMDDFGSGYSSLNLLKDFEFDEIKLDMVFMRSVRSMRSPNRLYVLSYRWQKASALKH